MSFLFHNKREVITKVVCKAKRSMKKKKKKKFDAAQTCEHQLSRVVRAGQNCSKQKTAFQLPPLQLLLQLQLQSFHASF